MTRIWHCEGHGGVNKGGEHAGLRERDWVLEMARDIDPSLGAWDIEIRHARDGDVTLDYYDRATRAHEWGANLVICHHVNAMVYPRGHPIEGEPNPHADGFLCFALAADNMGLEVGSAIMRAAPKDLRTRKSRCIPTNAHDWTRNANSVMLHYGRQGIPVVLIEWGFSTSPRDRAVLTGAEHRPALVAAALAGVGRFLELVSRPPAPDHR